MKTSPPTQHRKKEGSAVTQRGKELKTDLPMSEKDEIKKAEEQMRKQAKGE